MELEITSGIFQAIHNQLMYGPRHNLRDCDIVGSAIN